MTKNRSYSIAFKRQVAEEYLAGAAASVLGKRHDLCRNLVRIWVRKYEAREYDDDARAADTLQEFEAKVAALEQLVGRQALEIEFLKAAVRSARSPNGAPISAITGPRHLRRAGMCADGRGAIELLRRPGGAREQPARQGPRPARSPGPA